MHTAAETVRLLQTMHQCFVVHRVEGGGKFEQRQNSEITTIYCSKYVRQNLQDRRFRGIIGTVGRLQVGHQIRSI